jgi:hypothetical protein
LGGKKMNKELNKKFDLRITSPFVDCSSVLALGNVKLIRGDFMHVRVNPDYLKKAFEIISQLNPDAVDIVICTDSPLILGKFDIKKKEINGVILAGLKVDYESEAMEK